MDKQLEDTFRRIIREELAAFKVDFQNTNTNLILSSNRSIDEKFATLINNLRTEYIAQYEELNILIKSNMAGNKKVDINKQNLISVKLSFPKNSSVEDFVCAIGKNASIGESFFDSLVAVSGCGNERAFIDACKIIDDAGKEKQKPTKRGEKLKFVVAHIFTMAQYAQHLEEIKKLHVNYMKNAINGSAILPTTYYIGCSDMINRQSLSDSDTINLPTMLDDAAEVSMPVQQMPAQQIPAQSQAPVVQQMSIQTQEMPAQAPVVQQMPSHTQTPVTQQMPTQTQEIQAPVTQQMQTQEIPSHTQAPVTQQMQTQEIPSHTQAPVTQQMPSQQMPAQAPIQTPVVQEMPTQTQTPVAQQAPTVQSEPALTSAIHNPIVQPGQAPTLRQLFPGYITVIEQLEKAGHTVTVEQFAAMVAQVTSKK